jgi:ketosteroid isomerase-like protein
VLHGRDEVRSFFREAEEAGRLVSVRPRTFAEDGDEIVVSGSMRVGRPGGGFAESQIRWIYRFRDGRLEEAAWAPRHPG